VGWPGFAADSDSATVGAAGEDVGVSAESMGDVAATSADSLLGEDVEAGCVGWLPGAGLEVPTPDVVTVSATVVAGSAERRPIV